LTQAHSLPSLYVGRGVVLLAMIELGGCVHCAKNLLGAHRLERMEEVLAETRRELLSLRRELRASTRELEKARQKLAQEELLREQQQQRECQLMRELQQIREDQQLREEKLLREQQLREQLQLREQQLLREHLQLRERLQLRELLHLREQQQRREEEEEREDQRHQEQQVVLKQKRNEEQRSQVRHEMQSDNPHPEQAHVSQIERELSGSQKEIGRQDVTPKNSQAASAACEPDTLTLMKPCAHGGTAWPPGAQDHAAATAGLGSRQENRLLSKSMETSQYPRKTTRTRNMTGRSLTPSPSQKKHSGASLRTPLASRPSANMIESPSSAKKVYAQIMATPGSTIKGPRLNSASAISTKVLVSPSMRSEKQGDGKGTNVLRCSSSNWSASRRPPRVQPSPAARVGAPPQRRPRTKLQTMQTGPWATSALEGLRRVQSRKELTKKAATKLQAVVRGNAARGIATRKWIEAQCGSLTASFDLSL